MKSNLGEYLYDLRKKSGKSTKWKKRFKKSICGFGLSKKSIY